MGSAGAFGSAGVPGRWAVGTPGVAGSDGTEGSVPFVRRPALPRSAALAAFLTALAAFLAFFRSAAFCTSPVFGRPAPRTCFCTPSSAPVTPPTCGSSPVGRSWADTPPPRAPVALPTVFLAVEVTVPAVFFAVPATSPVGSCLAVSVTVPVAGRSEPTGSSAALAATEPRAHRPVAAAATTMERRMFERMEVMSFEFRRVKGQTCPAPARQVQLQTRSGLP